MPTRSETQYHIREPTFEVDPNIANIIKLLEDLSAWLSNVEEELKSNTEHETAENVSENGPCNENHTSRNNVQTYHDAMNLKNIKLEAPTFDDHLDPQVFFDWTSDMGYYFDWYDMSNKRRIWFAKMKLVGQARQYWTNVEKLMKLRHKKPIQTWDEMMMKL